MIKLSNKTRKQIYLHIGFEKTGSTSIQKYFSTYSSQLEKAGVFYLADKKNKLVYDETHWPMAAMLAKNNKFVPPSKHFALDDAKKYVSEALDSTKCEKIIFSAEPFSSMLLDRGRIKALKEIFGDSDVKILAYIRRQDGFFLSHISNYVKGGQVIVLSKEMTLEGTGICYENGERYDYKHILSMWSDVFGRENMIVRRFEPSALKGKDVVVDALDVLGVDCSDLPVSTRANKRLPVDTLLFLNLLNAGALPALLGGYRARVIDSLTLYPSKRPRQQLISNQLRRKIIEYYDQRNMEVASLYLGADGPLFMSPLPDEDAAWKPVYPLIPKEILDLTIHLHQAIPEVSERIVRSLCRPMHGKGPKYLWAQRQLLPAYAEVIIGSRFDE